MAHTLVSSGASFELHYCVRSEKNAAFLHELRSIVPENKFHLHLDDGDPTKGLDIKELLTKPQDNYHVYFCGPAGLLTIHRMVELENSDEESKENNQQRK